MLWAQASHRDEWLLHELRQAAADAAAVPAAARGVAGASLTWRKIDDELTLALCFDSAVNKAALVRGSSSMTARSMSFETDSLGVEIDIYDEELIGQIHPAQSGRVRVVTPQGVYAQTAADAAGCFVLSCPPHGPLRLECSVENKVLVTEWAPV